MKYLTILMALFFSNMLYAGIPVKCLCELQCFSEATGPIVVFSKIIDGWNDCDSPKEKNDEEKYGPSYKECICIHKIKKELKEVPNCGEVRLVRYVTSIEDLPLNDSIIKNLLRK